MNSFPLMAPTANTHVYRDLVIDGWEVMECEDDQRHQQLNSSLSQAPLDVVGQREVWSDTIGDELENDLFSDDPGLCKQRDKARKFNGSGVGLATHGASPSQLPAFATTSANGIRTVHPPVQAPVARGLAGVTSRRFLQETFWIATDSSDQIPADAPVTMGPFTTHMPTNASADAESHRYGFRSLASAITKVMSANPAAAVICTGELSALAAVSNPDAFAAAGQNGFPVIGLDVSYHRPSLKAGLQATTT